MAPTSLGACKIIFDENLQDMNFIKELPTCPYLYGPITKTNLNQVQGKKTTYCLSVRTSKGRSVNSLM